MEQTVCLETTSEDSALVYTARAAMISKSALQVYGSVHWDLGNPMSKICVIWRKDLRRVWGHPYAYATHYEILPVLCNKIQISEELYRRTANFIHNCLSSQCRIVQNVTRRGVFFSLMILPIGRNDFRCYSSV